MVGEGLGNEGGAQLWVQAQKEILFSAGKSGILDAKLVENSLATRARGESWGDLMRQDALARGKLKAALGRSQATCEEGERRALGEWEEKMEPMEVLELPEGLLHEWRGFEHEKLLKEEYILRCGQKPSDGLPLARAQAQPPLGFQPKSAEELFEPWAWIELQTWIAKQLAFLKDIRRRGSEARRMNSEVLALGASALVKEARGVWWDCRGDRPVPLDVEQVEESHINFGLLVEEAER